MSNAARVSLFPLLLAVSLAASTARAVDLPLSFTTTGYLLDQNDDPVTQAGLTVQVSLWDDATSAVTTHRVWGESTCVVDVANGYFAALLEGSLTTGCGAGLTTAQLPGGQPRYLQLTIGTTTLLPRVRLGAAPAATRAEDAHTLDGETVASLRDASQLTGVLPASALGAGSTGLTTLGTVTTGTWNATPIADGAIASAAAWHGKLGTVAHDGTLAGTGTGADPLRANTGAVAGTIAAGDDARFGQWTGGATGLVAATGRTSLGLGTAATQASTAFATAAQGTKADDALPRTGGTLTGAVTMNAGAAWGSDGSLSLGTTSLRHKLMIASGDGLTRLGLNGSSTTFSYAGGQHNDLIIGSRQVAGGATESIFSTGYGTGDRKFQFGTASGSDFATATFVPKVTITDSGNVGLGTTAPAAMLDVRGPARVQGVPLDASIGWDDLTMFAPQAYFEGSYFPWAVLSGAAPSFVAVNSTVVPFGKVALSTGVTEFAGDFVPVIPGDTLYGEIWSMRETGSTGTAGHLYFGIARYDKDRKPIAGNSGLDYFAANAVTVPQTSTWTRYSGTTQLPTSHTPFSGSDGGPVRYVRPYVIVNYNAGSVPTYWGGLVLRRQSPLRDSGRVGFNGPVRLNTPTGPGTNMYTRHYQDFTGNVPKKLLGWDGNKLGFSRSALAFCWITGTSSPGTSTWMVKQRESAAHTNTFVERMASFGSTTANTPEIFVDGSSELSIRMYANTSNYDIACTMIELGF